jgi:tRNA modification GTPase
VEGIPLRLADTAGLREPPGRPDDAAERMGIARSRELLNEADLVLCVIDCAVGMSREDREYLKELGEERQIPILRLWNKADTAPPEPELIRISAKTGGGIPLLLSAIAEVLERAALIPEGPGSERQKDLIRAALASAEEALDLAAPLLREGVNCLGEITGEVSTAEILETMFSRFCVGK